MVSGKYSGGTKRLVLVAGTSLLAVLPLVIQWDASSPQDSSLPRLAQVSPFLYRSGQPSEEGFKKLAAMGIRTVIDLRGAGKRARKERALVESLGMRYENVPLSNLRRPTDDQIRRIFEVIADPKARPVLVHCRRGEDRTGVVVALYRILYEGWEAEHAYREMRRFGFKWYLWGMKGYVFDFARRLHAAPIQGVPFRAAKLPGGD
ncbi:MAG TPA: protein tyrosine phosphatase family protein [Blastocatellia bacterium]|nr:protein tyrosine phosphatase family protein [Blastocatellia bacterium]